MSLMFIVYQILFLYIWKYPRTNNLGISITIEKKKGGFVMLFYFYIIFW